ncbi:hypothetical protein LCGC14_1143270 [marine sediment metagenome]|uniref:Scaffolding protein n=1 Tax=marine sediment metagenome TaxID=412755 RepID=A0A0F9PFU3_9ZZZZ
MAEEAGKTDGEGGEGGSGGEEFKPESLSKEAQEYIRKSIQSESDSKSALVEKRLRDDQAAQARSAVETAESNELRQLAATGQHEALGQRVAARLTEQTAEARAIASASDVIERQMSDKFAETLGSERVETIRQEVIKEGGAHAEFAAALAKASGGESRQEEIQAEVKAQLLAAGVKVRDEETGADKVSGAGQGTKLSPFEEIEQGYADGTVKREAYAAAKKARDEGQ